MVTASGVYINGYLRTVGLPSTAPDAIGLLSNANEGVVMKVTTGKHPISLKKTVEIHIGGHPAISFINDTGEKLIPCIDMADERILSLWCPERPTHRGQCVHYEKGSVYTNPEEKIEDFQREACMQKRICDAANHLGLGHLVPELLGPGLCFVGQEKDPAIISRHMGAAESAMLRFSTPWDIADVVRGKIWHCSFQQHAGVAQGDDYPRNTLCKRKRANGPYDVSMIDFGWAKTMSPGYADVIMFRQLVGFFVEFAHKNYFHAAPAGKDMIMKILDILASGRTFMVFSSHMELRGALVPNWNYIQVWQKTYPETDTDFVQQMGSNCQPKSNFEPLESMQIIKRKLLQLADEGCKRRKI